MGYYAQLLIEAKERYGHILKDRGLVMRGEADGDDLILVFRSEYGKWRLPVDISVPGKKSTGTDRAEWKDVEVSALVHSKVNIGKDWVGYVERHSEQLSFCRGDSMKAFVKEIGVLLKDVVVIPNEIMSNDVASEVAAAYHALHKSLKVAGRDIEFTKVGDVQRLTTIDGGGREFTFVWSPDTEGGELTIDGQTVEKFAAFDYTDIENSIISEFEVKTKAGRKLG